jgi:SHS family lactate transporter-like MFS transporter
VTESEAWKQNRMPGFRSIVRTAVSNWKLFAYLVGMMSLMHFLSHGTQDLYPHFLKSEHGFSTSTVANIAILYNIGSLLGAVIFGRLSERIGRRRSLVAATLVAFCAIPLWAFGSGLTTLAIGAFLMQVGVQGAWGIIPAHLNELSPAALRGLIPGLAYQLGILVAAPVNNIEYALRDHFGYSWALAGFEVVNIIVLATVVTLGPERSGQDFLTSPAAKQ